MPDKRVCSRQGGDPGIEHPVAFYKCSVRKAWQPIYGQKYQAKAVDIELNLSETDILELYSMRWAIEVYFKEAKQHLGFLKE
jgi:hypothetical protein